MVGKLCSNPDAMDLMSRLRPDLLHTPELLSLALSLRLCPTATSDDLSAALTSSSATTWQTPFEAVSTESGSQAVGQTEETVPTSTSTPSSKAGEGAEVVFEAGTLSPFCIRFLLDLVRLFNEKSEMLTSRGEMIIT
ncbi:unnamed protein product [Protopolystoma xenopodis]|uniref:Uncharacterized protein n=1 Tax=Protopolystoma xenopodis TaxID=117903 RepID=A0A448WHE4_9PLAT|nr:unnamed protein product [Protopolystoma xenopodis]